MADVGTMKNENIGSEVVYGHKMRDEASYFHIGSGSEQRARNLNGRSDLWREYVDTHGGSSHIEVSTRTKLH